MTFEILYLLSVKSFEYVFKVCRNQRNGARVDDPRNCRFFITCFNQQGTGDECRDGELFETNLKRCVNKGAVQCGRRPINGREIDLNGQISSSVR